MKELGYAFTYDNYSITELDSNNFQNKLHIEITKNEDVQLQKLLPP